MKVALVWAMSGQVKQILVPGGCVVGGSQQRFIQVGSAPTSSPLPFYIPFYGEKVPFPVPSINYYYSLLTAVNALTLRYE